MAFINDLGFLYGAGIAQKRQADSFLLSGWSVSIFAHRPPTSHRYAFWTGAQKLDRRLLIRPPLTASATAIVDAIMMDRPDLVIVGNVHGADLPMDFLSRLREGGATVAVYMHDCYWVTGRCAYPGSCAHYITGCDSSCPTPDEYPKLAPDKIAAAWEQRNDLFRGPRAIPLVANSRWTAQLAKRRFPDARVDVIHLGIDSHLFTPINKEMARRMMGLPDDKPIVVLGSLNVDDRFKGGPLFRELCAALTSRTDIRVAVIGKGSHSIDGVHPLGLVNDERVMPLILNCADIYVSTAMEEAFGQMLLEAASCGVPTVAIDAGGVSDIVTADTGILVRDKSAPALETAINALLSDGGLRRKMGRAARERVLQNFTLKHQADAWAKYLGTFTPTESG